MPMCFEVAFDTGFSESYTEPWLSPTIGKHGVPSRRSIKRLDLHLKQLFHSITKCVVLCFRRLKGDALLCPRKLIYTCISYTINYSAKYRPPVGCLTSASAQTSKEIPAQVPLWKEIPQSEIPVMYERTPNVAFQWTAFGAEQYLATGRTALERSGHVEIAHHIKLTTK